MMDPFRRQSVGGGRSRADSMFQSTVRAHRASQVRLPPFNADHEAVEFFYRREKTCPSLPKRILEQVFGADFVDRLISRAPAMKKRDYTPNQYEDLAKLIRVYLRYIATADMFYARAIAMLPAKAFTTDKLPVKQRMSIFGGARRQSATGPGGKGDPKKFRSAYLSGGFGHLAKGGKKVAPVGQLVFEDPMTLKQTLNITREDCNPNAPLNVLKFSQKVRIFFEIICFSLHCKITWFLFIVFWKIYSEFFFLVILWWIVSKLHDSWRRKRV